MVLIIVVILVLLLTTALVVAFGKLRQQTQAYRAQQAVSVRIQNDIRALLKGAAGLGEHVSRLEQQLKRVIERQNQLDLRDPAVQSYEHAIKLARNGADKEELMTSCGLVRDEAELVLRVYGLDKAS